MIDSFTERVAQETISACEREYFLELAQLSLKFAREHKDNFDVSGDVDGLRWWAASVGVSLAELGTNEEELKQLAQIGYKSEARNCLELARGMFGCSRIRLYLRAVRNNGLCFCRGPNFYWFKLFLKTIFCLRQCTTCRDWIARTRKYLAKANLSPTDIGIDEAELVKLGS